jgi:hypothetical protein
MSNRGPGFERNTKRSTLNKRILRTVKEDMISAVLQIRVHIAFARLDTEQIRIGNADPDPGGQK